MSYLFKDFLSLEDVGEYLNQYGYSYDPEMQADYYKLKDTILDLYNEKKLNIVFHYNDFALIKTLRIAENLGIEEVEDEEFEFYISGYFHIENPTPIFKNESKLVIRDGAYFYYFLYNKDKLPIYDDTDEYKHEAGRKFTSIEFGDNIEPTVIDFCDLRYPKADLDKLFSTKNDELNSVKDELAEVKSQNAKLVANIEENRTTGNFSMGTPTVEHGEPETYEHLVEALTAANAKIKQQAQDINRLNDQLNKQADKPLRYNSEMGVARMLYAILTEHNYDLSATKGKANNLIEKASQLHGTPVARNFIAKWIELSNQAKSDSTK